MGFLTLQKSLTVSKQTTDLVILLFEVSTILQFYRMNTWAILAILSILFVGVSAHTDGCRCGTTNAVCRKHQWMIVGMLSILVAYLWIHFQYYFNRYCGPCALACARMKARLRACFCGKKNDDACHHAHCGHGHSHSHSHGVDDLGHGHGCGACGENHSHCNHCHHE